MNYVSVVIGIFLIVCSAYWLVYGDRYEGPVSFPLLFQIRIWLTSCFNRSSKSSWVASLVREMLPLWAWKQSPLLGWKNKKQCNIERGRSCCQ